MDFLINKFLRGCVPGKLRQNKRPWGILQNQVLAKTLYMKLEEEYTLTKGKEWGRRKQTKDLIVIGQGNGNKWQGRTQKYHLKRGNKNIFIFLYFIIF